MIGTIWIASQVALIGMVVYIAITDGVEWTKENTLSVALMLTFGPLALMAVFGMFAHEHYQTKKRARCAKIMAVWENLARAKTSNGRWDWYMNKSAQEERYNLLRESIRLLTADDLQLLSSTSKATYDIDKPLRDAIVDELIERRILSDD